MSSRALNKSASSWLTAPHRLWSVVGKMASDGIESSIRFCGLTDKDQESKGIWVGMTGVVGEYDR